MACNDSVGSCDIASCLNLVDEGIVVDDGVAERSTRKCLRRPFLLKIQNEIRVAVLWKKKKSVILLLKPCYDVFFLFLEALCRRAVKATLLIPQTRYRGSRCTSGRCRLTRLTGRLRLGLGLPVATEIEIACMQMRRQWLTGWNAHNLSIWKGFGGYAGCPDNSASQKGQDL
jgi:hypothetical protein